MFFALPFLLIDLSGRVFLLRRTLKKSLAQSSELFWIHHSDQNYITFPLYSSRCDKGYRMKLYWNGKYAPISNNRQNDSKVSLSHLKMVFSFTCYRKEGEISVNGRVDFNLFNVKLNFLHAGAKLSSINKVNLFFSFQFSCSASKTCNYGNREKMKRSEMTFETTKILRTIKCRSQFLNFFHYYSA